MSYRLHPKFVFILHRSLVEAPVHITERVLRSNILWMNHKALVLSNDSIIVSRTDNFVFLSSFMLRDEFLTHMGRPEVFGCLAFSTESFFKLAWMKEVYECSRGTFAS